MKPETLTEWSAAIAAIMATVAIPARVAWNLVAGAAKRRREARQVEAASKRDATANWIQQLQSENRRLRSGLDEARSEARQLNAELRQAYKDLSMAAAYVRYCERSSKAPGQSGTKTPTPRSTPDRSTEQRLPPPPRLPRFRTRS